MVSTKSSIFYSSTSKAVSVKVDDEITLPIWQCDKGYAILILLETAGGKSHVWTIVIASKADAIKTRCDEGSAIYLPLETAGGKQQVKFDP